VQHDKRLYEFSCDIIHVRVEFFPEHTNDVLGFASLFLIHIPNTWRGFIVTFTS
jgi:hypothetical protein